MTTIETNSCLTTVEAVFVSLFCSLTNPFIVCCRTFSDTDLILLHLNFNICNLILLGNVVELKWCWIESCSSFGCDVGGLISFEMIYRRIFHCCSRQQQRPSLPLSLIIAGMSKISFAINCPHVAEVYKSCLYKGRNSGGRGRGRASCGVTEWRRKIKTRANSRLQKASFTHNHFTPIRRREL